MSLRVFAVLSVSWVIWCSFLLERFNCYWILVFYRESLPHGSSLPRHGQRSKSRERWEPRGQEKVTKTRFFFLLELSFPHLLTNLAILATSFSSLWIRSQVGIWKKMNALYIPDIWKHTYFQCCESVSRIASVTPKKSHVFSGGLETFLWTWNSFLEVRRNLQANCT